MAGAGGGEGEGEAGEAPPAAALPGKAPPDRPDAGEDSDPDDGTGVLSRAVDAARSRLLADATLIEALVRIDEVEVATRAVSEQRSGLVELAIDLREAVAEALRERDGAADAARPDPLGELGG